MADSIITEFDSVKKAFSKQAEHYDQDDFSNPILLSWRKQVYDHVNSFLKVSDTMLELNAGTGIDALHFAQQGNQILATDYSPGMVQKIQGKIKSERVGDKLTCQQCSFESLQELAGKKFDYVFSNFGGLNCSGDLTRVTNQLSLLLNSKAIVTWVIMPPICPWEIFRVFKGKRDAFRRLKSGGVMAHLEGEHFRTYYYSVADLKKAFGKDFTLLRAEGLGTFAPPPSALSFTNRNPKFTSLLRWLDRLVRNIFPFNRWGDHIIVTFQYSG
ncbi:MAG TPA: methyltransferase domain-containing protein [Cyclobacteriaceae bacterium]|nr:methyltransferase domain-containing protein [Cyclobacteriaceae bacterium]